MLSWTIRIVLCLVFILLGALCLIGIEQLQDIFVNRGFYGFLTFPVGLVLVGLAIGLLWPSKARFFALLLFALLSTLLYITFPFSTVSVTVVGIAFIVDLLLIATVFMSHKPANRI